MRARGSNSSGSSPLRVSPTTSTIRSSSMPIRDEFRPTEGKSRSSRRLRLRRRAAWYSPGSSQTAPHAGQTSITTSSTVSASSPTEHWGHARFARIERFAGCDSLAGGSAGLPPLSIASCVNQSPSQCRQEANGTDVVSVARKRCPSSGQRKPALNELPGGM